MKNWEYRERARETLAREVGYVQKPHGGRLRVALAFPNTYYVGMSSLGFQTVYRLFNQLDDVVCERVFLPGRQELREQLESGAPFLTLESQTPVRDFDVLAFSVSFEWDYTNVVSMLRLAGLAPRADARSGRDPLVVIGGAVTFVNPEPLALFADVIAAGEGEMLIPALVVVDSERRLARRALRAAGRSPRLLHPVVLRRALRRGRDDCGVRGEAGIGRAAGGEESGGEEHGQARPAGDIHLYAGHRVRLAVPDRGRARLRQPVPVLLGGLQLPARTGLPGRPHPRARQSGTDALGEGRAGIDRAVRPPRNRAHPARPARHGLLDQPGLPAPGRSRPNQSCSCCGRAANDRSRSLRKPDPIASAG